MAKKSKLYIYDRDNDEIRFILMGTPRDLNDYVYEQSLDQIFGITKTKKGLLEVFSTQTIKV